SPLSIRPPLRSALFPYTTLFRSATVLDELGFTGFTIRLNHRELLRAVIRAAGIDEALESTALVAVDKLDKIGRDGVLAELGERGDRKSTRLNSSHVKNSYAVFCL